MMSDKWLVALDLIRSLVCYLLLLRRYSHTTQIRFSAPFSNALRRRVNVVLEFIFIPLCRFSEFVYEVVVDKKFVPEEILNVLKQEPIILPPWDPMGALACRDCERHE